MRLTSTDKGENIARNREETTLSEAAAATPGHLLAVVRLENGAFSVTQVTRVPGKLPAKRGDGGPAGWIVRAEHPPDDPPLAHAFLPESGSTTPRYVSDLHALRNDHLPETS